MNRNVVLFFLFVLSIVYLSFVHINFNEKPVDKTFLQQDSNKDYMSIEKLDLNQTMDDNVHSKFVDEKENSYLSYILSLYNKPKGIVTEHKFPYK